MPSRAALAIGMLLARSVAVGKETAPANEAPTQIRVQIVFAKAAALEEFTLAELDHALVMETNRVRAAHDCRPLRELPELAAAAGDQAAFMALTMTVTHTSPIKGQRDVRERAQRHGISDVSLLAENALSAAFHLEQEKPLTCAEVAARLIAQWMDSPGHRANLLNDNFTTVGCAARRLKFLGGVENFYATQVFAAR